MQHILQGAVAVSLKFNLTAGVEAYKRPSEVGKRLSYFKTYMHDITIFYITSYTSVNITNLSEMNYPFEPRTYTVELERTERQVVRLLIV